MTRPLMAASPGAGSMGTSVEEGEDKTGEEIFTVKGSGELERCWWCCGVCVSHSWPRFARGACIDCDSREACWMRLTGGELTTSDKVAPSLVSIRFGAENRGFPRPGAATNIQSGRLSR